VLGWKIFSSLLRILTNLLKLQQKQDFVQPRLQCCSLLLIYQPWEDERVCLPSWLNSSGRFTHISGHSSAEGEACDRESSPAKTDVLPLSHATKYDDIVLSEIKKEWEKKKQLEVQHFYLPRNKAVYWYHGIFLTIVHCQKQGRPQGLKMWTHNRCNRWGAERAWGRWYVILITTSP